MQLQLYVVYRIWYLYLQIFCLLNNKLHFITTTSVILYTIFVLFSCFYSSLIYTLISSNTLKAFSTVSAVRIIIKLPMITFLAYIIPISQLLFHDTFPLLSYFISFAYVLQLQATHLKQFYTLIIFISQLISTLFSRSLKCSQPYRESSYYKTKLDD